PPPTRRALPPKICTGGVVRASALSIRSSTGPLPVSVELPRTFTSVPEPNEKLLLDNVSANTLRTLTSPPGPKLTLALTAPAVSLPTRRRSPLTLTLVPLSWTSGEAPVLVSEPPPWTLIKLPPVLSAPPVSLRSELLTDTLAPGAIRMKSPPVVIVVGSVLSTGRLEVLENDPRTFRRLSPMVRLALMAWNSGRSRLAGTGVVVSTWKALPGTFSAPGGITTGVEAEAAVMANLARFESMVMFEGTPNSGVAATEVDVDAPHDGESDVP